MHSEAFRLLEVAEVASIVGELGKRKFVNGKATAGGRARDVKNNLQTERKDATPTKSDEILIAAFARHEQFQCFAMPCRFVAPIFSKYEPGMEYGAHVDNSLMGGFHGIRTDYSMTVFLSDPASYDGGELVIQSSGEQEIKLDAGEAFVYPSSMVHYVAPVTRGVRMAAVTWFQSAVRDEWLRTILYDLNTAVGRADKLKEKDLSLLLTKSYHNLVRYASEPAR